MGACPSFSSPPCANEMALGSNAGGRSRFHQQALAAKDAVFISGHKFLGGAGTPGLLVCKKRLFCRKSPAVPGGGTVVMVSRSKHTYHR